MRIRALISFAAVGTALAFLPAPAAAEVPRNHCVLDLSRTTFTCYDTFAAASTPADRSRYVLSIEYDDNGFESSSMTVFGDHQCTPSLDDVDYEVPELLMDNVISAYRAGLSGLCWVQHFEDPHFQGRSIGPDEGRADMGELDNQTSSIRWT